MRRPGEVGVERRLPGPANYCAGVEASASGPGGESRVMFEPELERRAQEHPRHWVFRSEFELCRDVEERSQFICGPAGDAPGVDGRGRRRSVEAGAKSARAPEGAASWPGQAAAIEAGRGLRLEAPIAAASKEAVVARRIANVAGIPVRTRFDEQDGGVWILSEAGGEDAAGTATADDDVIELFFALGAAEPRRGKIRGAVDNNHARMVPRLPWRENKSGVAVG